MSDEKAEYASRKTRKKASTTGEKVGKTGTLRASVVAQLGAVGSALIASACCWLPLLLVVFGVSGGALSARFAELRPVTLPVTFLFLGVAFYFTYRKPRAYSSGGEESGVEECCEAAVAENGMSRLRKINKITLWVATAFALAFAFFPNYSGLFFKNTSPVAVTESAEVVRWEMEIRGMTCESCAVSLEKKLKETPGVQDAKVSYENKRAVVFAAPSVTADDLKQVVRGQGYRAVNVKKGKGVSR